MTRYEIRYRSCHSGVRKTYSILQMRCKQIVILMLPTYDFDHNFIILTAIYQCISDALPGILTSLHVNLLKTNVCNSLKRNASICLKNAQKVDGTILVHLPWLQAGGVSNVYVTGVNVSRFCSNFIRYRRQIIIPQFVTSILRSMIS